MYRGLAYNIHGVYEKRGEAERAARRRTSPLVNDAKKEGTAGDGRGADGRGDGDDDDDWLVGDAYRVGWWCCVIGVVIYVRRRVVFEVSALRAFEAAAQRHPRETPDEMYTTRRNDDSRRTESSSTTTRFRVDAARARRTTRTTRRHPSRSASRAARVAARRPCARPSPRSPAPVSPPPRCVRRGCDFDDAVRGGAACRLVVARWRQLLAPRCPPLRSVFDPLGGELR